MKQSSKPRKFYAVFRGRGQGVFKKWEDVIKLVDGHKNAYYKGYQSQAEAKKALQGYITWSTNEHRKKLIKAKQNLPMESKIILCLQACLEILVKLASEKKETGFSILHKRVQKAAELEISRQFFELVLEKVNEQSWKERKVLLTVIVRCKFTLPGMKFWAQAKTLGAVKEVPQHELEQQATAGHLRDRVYSAYQFSGLNPPTF